MNVSGRWLSLMEYATLNSVSLSTLRRHIKADKVRYRSENGRYLVWCNDADLGSASVIAAAPVREMTNPGLVTELQRQLQKAQEEIAELKTLVAFYEEQSEGLRAIR